MYNILRSLMIFSWFQQANSIVVFRDPFVYKLECYGCFAVSWFSMYGCVF